MRQIVCVRLLSWPTDRIKRRRPLLRSKPLVLIAQGRRNVVAAACALARKGHVREGMTLAEASAVCGELVHLPFDPQQDDRALEALARWIMARFSPQVAIGGHNAIFAEIGGSVRLLGSLNAIARQMALALRWMRISAHLAVAPTAGAAWALAAAGKQEIIDNEADLPATLAPLPVNILRIDPAVADALVHVGVSTIGQLAKLPRSALPARFGTQLLQRLDQAHGYQPELLEWLPPRSPVRQRMTFEHAIDSLEAAWAVLEKLIPSVLGELVRRGQGARRLSVRFEHEKPPAVVRTITLSRPTRQAKTMLELLRLSTESINAREGFVAIELAVPETQPLSDQQASFTEEAVDTGAELNAFVDRVRARLGETAVLRPQLIESHVPERAFAWTPDGGGPATLAIPPRPMSLLPRPVEIGVVVTPSDDRDGRPAAFTHGKRVYRLRLVVGPERIAGEWWAGHNKTRDYFDVEDETGQRFWIFRVAETFKWYLHGIFT